MDLDRPWQRLPTAALLEAEQILLDPLRRYKVWRKDVREDTAATKALHKVMQSLVDTMRDAGPLQHCRSPAGHQRPQHWQALEDKRLLPEASTLFMAGFETTGHTAAWVLFAVSQHSEVEANIVKELRSQDLLASPQAAAPRPIQWDDIPQLVYLTATIKETMRLYPVAGGATFRHSKSGKDVALRGGKLILS
ncbi:g8629 [Coccomyxa viridis]|uniref:G8629 protein n=1 Tax=Coccomyxa viridis TaxID=1274662 RepID=A0ABP1G0V7_9CHLO